jgi:hypothetical protein
MCVVCAALPPPSLPPFLPAEGFFDETQLRATVIAYNLFVFGLADEYVSILEGDIPAMNREGFAESQRFPGVARLLEEMKEAQVCRVPALDCGRAAVVGRLQL